ncbi:hypothetical protein X797_012072 [Metarhizium robertsii]|uniref:Uncharacterized protein n=1 Tax=Metarhizium robertsii TaxID=568076 RepID=A0A014N583_9HYPO|nr:hypothetical protein X797_012072 [Metarhizium robertsii]
MALVQTGCPSRFASPDEHRIKDLNAETIARICLPTPTWLMSPEYAILQSTGKDSENQIYVSLNIAIYNQQLDPSEWTEQWFFMTGRLHPYALTWRITQLDGLETEIGTISEYTIPAFIVRDSSFQPLTSISSFPSVPPTVSLTGPVIGSGQKLLAAEVVSILGDAQMRCCGFLQLSSFITPGDSAKPPFRGFHPFQAFIIFPIHANPWSVLCKKMIDRQDTQFQPGAPFTCTGKVAGLLDHALMARPPELERDHVLIVVPDTWTFLDRNAATSSSSVHQQLTPSKASTPAPSSLSEVAAGFTTTLNQDNYTTRALPTPEASPTTTRVAAAGAKRTRQVSSDPQDEARSIKQPRLSSSQSASSTISSSSIEISSSSPTTQHTYAEADAGSSMRRALAKAPAAPPAPNLARPTSPVLDGIVATPAEAANRPHRQRQPTRKVQEGNTD